MGIIEKKRMWFCVVIMLVVLGMPSKVCAADIYECKPDNYIAWHSMPTISTSEQQGYYQITDIKNYGANLTNDMSLGDRYYNSMYYYSDTRITYQKKICVERGMKIHLVAALEDIGEGGGNASDMGKISWNVMEWNEWGGFLWDSGWITTEESYTVGLDERGHCSSWGIDYSVGNREEVSYITILFRFIDESGYEGAGNVLVTPENIAEHFPNLFLCYQPFTYTIDYNGYGSNVVENRLGTEAVNVHLSEISNKAGYEVRWKILSNSTCEQNWMNGNVYDASEINEWLANGKFYNSFFGDVTFQTVYIPKTFEVTYDSNGGGLTAQTRVYAYGDAVDLSLVMEREGYRFVGWSITPDSRIPLNSYTMPGEDIILYAVYSIAVSDVQNHTYPSYTPTEMVPDDEVYLRVWIKEEPTLCNYYPLTYVSDVGSMVYRYTLPLVDVSAFVNGRAYCYQLIVWDNAGNREILYEDSSDDTEIEDPEVPDTYIQVVEHYKYDACNKVWKWFEETRFRVEAGTEFVPAYISPPLGYVAESIDSGGRVFANHKYKAYYKPAEYSVTFDANGGVSDVLSKLVLYEGYYGTLPVPTDVGRTFLSWNTKRDGSGKTITSGDVYTIAGDSTLYAQYKVNTYTIQYHANGGRGSMSDSSVPYGEEFQLPKCKYSFDGFVFAGWSDSPMGEIRYLDMTSIQNLSDIDGDTIHLYAVYQKELAVTLVEMSDLGNITRTFSSIVDHRMQCASVVISEKGRWSGWSNIGWSDKIDATATPITSTGATFIASSDVTLYALYEKHVYVSYDTNGSKMQFDSQKKTCYYNAYGNASYPFVSVEGEPVLSKYSFVKWTVTKGCVKDEKGVNLSFCYPMADVMILEDTVFTAVWDAFPELEVYDRYFTLEEAQRGNITQEKLLDNVYGTDLEDGVLKNGVDVVLVNYDDEVFRMMTSEQNVQIVYQATDHFGNTVTKSVMVYVYDTSMKKEGHERYVRFISAQFLFDENGGLRSAQEGGLEETSIWRENIVYRELLQKTLTNTGDGKETWVFTKKEIEEIKEYSKRYGYIQEVVEDFLDLFNRCKK